MHPIFEKALHVLRLSPTYKDTYNFDWIGTDCGDGVSGGGIDEELPFTGARGFGLASEGSPLSASPPRSLETNRARKPVSPGVRSRGSYDSRNLHARERYMRVDRRRVL